METALSFVQRHNLTTRSLGSDVLIVNWDGQGVYRFNEAGHFLWMKFARPITRVAATRQLANEFEIPLGQAEADVTHFVGELVELGLLVEPSSLGSSCYHHPLLSIPLWNDLEQISLSECVPANVEFEITDYCNLKCQHCYLVRSRDPLLTGKEIRDVIDRLEELGCFILTITGGEIFLRQDLLDIIRYARDRQFAVELLTNANYVTTEIAGELAHLGVSRVQVSVYSADPEVHDRVTRVPGSFHKTIAGIRALTERGVQVVASCPVMTLNFESHQSVQRLAGDLGANVSFAYPITAKVDGSKATHRLRLGPNQLLEFHAVNRQQVCRTFDRHPDDHPCHAGIAIAFVNSHGSVYPCVAFPMEVGSVRQTDFKTIWQESPKLNELRNLRVRDLPVCGQCDRLQYCRLCLGISWLEDGNPRGPSSIYCQMAQVNREVYCRATN